jgi:Uma2 family endonuclease
MTAEEFMALPETNVPHELIDGELIVSPTPKDPHQGTVIDMLRYLLQKITTGIFRVAPMEVHFDDGNIVEPDIFWVSGPDSKCKLGDDGYWYGAPGLIVEVLSPSTETRDRKAKYELYEKYGVREYWLAHPEARFIEVFLLTGNTFTRKGLFEIGQTFFSDVLGQNVEVSAILNATA